MTYSLDIGNGFSVLYDGRKTQNIRSVVAEFNAPANKRPGDGWVVFNGKHYHVGDAAYRYDMYRSMAVTDKQVNGNIIDSIILTLYLIAPNRGSMPAATDIILQVPSKNSAYQHELVKALNGAKGWSVDGKSYDTLIRVQDVFQEGFGAWYMARRQGLIPNGGYTLVIDIGAGTAISALIESTSGEVIRTDSYAKSGVIYLANLLSNDYELRYQNGGKIVRTDQLFNAFEDGSFQIGATGANFREFYNVYSAQWWKHIWTQVVNSFHTQFDRNDVARVLITGGGAELVRRFIEAAKTKPEFRELFAISGSPLTDNVTGIYNYVKDHSK